MSLPTRGRPSFPHSLCLPPGSLRKPLILIHWGQTEEARLQSHGLQNESHSHRKWTKMITWITVLCNSMKLWARPCRATQDGWVMVESSDKTWSLEKGMANHFSILALRTPNSMKRQKDRTLKDDPTRSVGVQYATVEEHRNSSRRNEEAEPKQKWCPVVAVSGGESEVQCCKEHYCLRTCNVRSMNQGKLNVVKQEMARQLGISELKWTRMDKFNSDDDFIYTVGKNPLEEMEQPS